MNPQSGVAVAWPKERFFWAAIPGQAALRSGVAPPGVLVEIQDEFPVGIESLHVVVAPAEGNQLVVCAARRSDLAGLDSDVVTLCPGSVPERLPAPASLNDLNVLVGEFLPRALRRQRVRRHAAAILLVLGVSLLLSVGFERRAGAWDRLAHDEATLAKHVEQEAVGSGSALSLRQEVERLESLASAIQSNARPPAADPVATLAALCADWPTERGAKPQGFTVSNEAASLSVVVAGEARGFLESWHPPRGWHADEPRLGSSGDLTRINLTLRPDPARSHP